MIFMLSAWRSEKDYIMRRRAEYVAKVHAMVDSVVTVSDQSVLASTLKEEITHQMRA